MTGPKTKAPNSRRNLDIAIDRLCARTADDPDMVESPEATRVLAELGFPKPDPVPCMKLEHQIAQKLHAASSAGSERAHDLIDLQIIIDNSDVDYEAARRTCERLFAYRKEQAWPPTIAKGEGWDALDRSSQHNNARLSARKGGRLRLALPSAVRQLTGPRPPCTRPTRSRCGRLPSRSAASRSRRRTPSPCRPWSACR